MIQIKELAYFLDSIKETLPFDDEKDLIKKNIEIDVPSFLIDEIRQKKHH